MAKVRWSEDYGTYKKGDEFVIDNPDTLQYYIETGKVEVVKSKVEAKAETTETASAKETPTPAKKPAKK